jgi:hypothetical protein
MTHNEQLRARVSATEQRIARQLARLEGLRKLDRGGVDQAREALERLCEIRDTYVRILAGPCPLSERPPRVF